MDNARVFVWIALAAAVFMNITAWQAQFAAKPTSTPTAAAGTKAPISDPESDVLPPLPTAPTEAPPPATTTTPVGEAPLVSAKTVRVVTDVLDMDISARGGELLRADLLKYPKVKDRPDDPVRLLSTDPNELFRARSGLRAADDRAPTDSVLFEVAANEYRLKPSDSTLEVPLTWTDGRGLKVVKTYIFRPGSYRIELRYNIINRSGSPWSGAPYVKLFRHYVPVERSYFNVASNAYRGPSVHDNGLVKFEVDDDSKENYSKKLTNSWMAAVEHHFLVAAIPPSKPVYDFKVTFEPDGDYNLSYSGPLITVATGMQRTLKETLFVGPKLYRQLEEIHPELFLTADYGKLTMISKPLFQVLAYVQGWIGNWGWSIVIVTFLIKLAFYRLTAASGRSMAKMRNLGPRIKAIQERYKDDREKLGREMMDIYKREKINPLAGCLPVLIQIPFFFAYYWVLLESVEMRQAPFLGWIDDLSSRDPYFILPALMCAAMVGQFRLQPMPSTDPIQAKIFQFMPIVMSATMAFFPAGLVLYWLTNTLLSIAQQWRINKLVALEDKRPSLEKKRA
jgi:YidC/Oxa1 family membrane protein insertase